MKKILYIIIILGSFLGVVNTLFAISNEFPSKTRFSSLLELTEFLVSNDIEVYYEGLKSDEQITLSGKVTSKENFVKAMAASLELNYENINNKYFFYDKKIREVNDYPLSKIIPTFEISNLTADDAVDFLSKQLNLKLSVWRMNNSFSQSSIENKKISIQFKNISVRDALCEISKISGNKSWRLVLLKPAPNPSFVLLWLK